MLPIQEHVYLFIWLCHTWFLPSVSCSVLSTGFLLPYVYLFLSSFFFLFDALLNEIVSLIYPSDILLLIHRSASDFSILILYPVVTYGVSWTIKKAEHQRIDPFKLWCWRRFFRVTWTAKRSNQSILRETNPEYSLEGLVLKLKLQYFGHLMWRADSL